MQNLTTPVQLLKNATEYNITPQMPKVPLYQDVSEGLGTFSIYIFIIIVSIWILLYLYLYIFVLQIT